MGATRMTQTATQVEHQRSSAHLNLTTVLHDFSQQNLLIRPIINQTTILLEVIP